MAGKYQHYIPRFFSAEFACFEERKEAGRLWVYRPGQAVFPSSPPNIGGEGFFYSPLPKPGERTLDDEITAYEPRLLLLLRDIQLLSDRERVAPDVAAEIIAHLSIRVNSLRSAIITGSASLFEAVRERLSTPESARAHMGLDDETLSPVLLEELEVLRKQLVEAAGQEIPKGLFEDVCIAHLREQYETHYSETTATSLNAISSLVQALPEMVKNGHVKGLAANIVPPGQLKVLGEMNWQVVRFEGLQLILPDCVVIAANDLEARPYLFSEDDDAEIFLALGRHTLLQGSRAEFREITAERFNEMAARCSTDFFLSGVRTDQLAVLASEIGKATTSMLEEVIQDAFDGEKRAPATTVDHQSGLIDETEIPANTISGTFNLRFPTGFDKDRIDRIASLVRAVLREYLGVLSLGRLWGMQFFVSALSEVSQLGGRWDLGLLPRRSGIDDFNVYIYPFSREAGQDVALLFDLSIGEGLIRGQDDEELCYALYGLVLGIGYAGYLTDLQCQVPGCLPIVLDGKWGPNYQVWSIDIFGIYSAARFTAGLGTVAREDHEAACIRALRHAEALLRTERQAFLEKNDWNVLLQVAIPAGSLIVRAFARLLGYLHGREDENQQPGEALAAELATHALTQWIDVLGRDLKAIADSRPFTSMEPVWRLNRQIRRVLLTFGVAFWIDENGATMGKLV